MIPEAFRKYPQFVLANGKVPCDANGQNCDPHDPKNWLTAEQAEAHAMLGHGVGFVFTDNDPFFCVDIDHAVVNGAWSPLVGQLYTAFPNSYFEVSTSGEGVHIFGSYTTIPDHACKNTSLGIELYHTKRFILLTGNCAVGDAGTDFTAELPSVISAFYPPRLDQKEQEWTTEPVAEWRGPESDSDLLEIAFRSGGAKAAFGGGVTFQNLWEADVSALSGKWPSEGRPYDASSADASLASMLAFWTGKNCARMERMMISSALNRQKWVDHKSYLQMTILNACKLNKDVYQQRESVRADGPYVGNAEIVECEGFQYLSGAQQKDYFKGCVYVTDQHSILTRDGVLLEAGQFNAVYGGYEFQMESEGKSSKKAFEVFTESRLIRFPKVAKTTFRPDLPFQAITEVDGFSAVNVYKPAKVKCIKGDVTPFTNHMKKLVPDDRDREILMSYMAACVQHKGRKFYWCPLIQGVQGNGKSLFSLVIGEAVGWQYSHFPKADDLANKFNSWIRNKIFIGVEDIYMGDSRSEIMEALKPMITGERTEIQGKGKDQILDTVCANFILNTNHKDALIKTEDDRRYAVFYTAQQFADDLERDGMKGDYFPKLYEWLRGDGFGYVTHYLENFQIKDEFNPLVGLTRAPHTSSTNEAVGISMSPVAQEIQEAVEEGRVGLCGGWISLGKAKEVNFRRKLSPKKLTQIIQEMGYIPHPALKDGRTNNPTVTDQVKARLFIRKGHIAQNLTSAAEVLRVYDEAQSKNTLDEARRVFR